MQIGEVIRKYRKEKDMTQEEMASRLGVTAPAVNKWENGNSMPDIMLLAPIARLLDITVDTLLSFHSELEMEEINGIVLEANRRMREESYEKAFGWIRKKLEEYPGSDMLTWNLAVLLQANLLLKNPPERKEYEAYILSLYRRTLNSQDETVREGTAEALFSYYLEKDAYDEAEKYVEYFPKSAPAYKYKKALLYGKRGETKAAYQAYEELLFSSYTTQRMCLYGMFRLAVKEHDREKTELFADKMRDLARCMDMGDYDGAYANMELALENRDRVEVLKAAREILANVGAVGCFRESPLYEHMKFKEPSPEYREEMKTQLTAYFQDEETFGFMKGDEAWEKFLLNEVPSLYGRTETGYNVK